MNPLDTSLILIFAEAWGVTKLLSLDRGTSRASGTCGTSGTTRTCGTINFWKKNCNEIKYNLKIP